MKKTLPGLREKVSRKGRAVIDEMIRFRLDGRHLKTMFDASERKDGRFLEQYLKKYKREINSDRYLKVGYYLALYQADPSKYEDEFVNAYPVHEEALTHFYEYFLEDQENYEPPVNPMETLKAIALKGNRTAIRKLLLSARHPREGDAAILNEASWEVLSKQPKLTIEEMASSISAKGRKHLYSWLGKMPPDFTKTLLALKNEVSQKERIIIDEILTNQQQNR